MEPKELIKSVLKESFGGPLCPKSANNAGCYYSGENTCIRCPLYSELNFDRALEPEDYKKQVRAKYDTFAVVGVAEDGKLIDATSSIHVPSCDVKSIIDIVSKADKSRFNREAP